MLLSPSSLASASSSQPLGSAQAHTTLETEPHHDDALASVPYDTRHAKRDSARFHHTMPMPENLSEADIAERQQSLLQLPGIHISPEMHAEVKARAANAQPFVVGLQQAIHQNPELSGQEVQTAARVAEELRKMKLEVWTGVGGHGVVGTLRCGQPGGRKLVIALRADMDALNIRGGENTGLSYASQRPGVMHACGHDGHTAMLVGAAKVMSDMKEQIDALCKENGIEFEVKFVFQPAEENGTGAKAIIESGVIDDVMVMYGLHIDPRIESGKLGVRAGEFFAGADAWEVTYKHKLPQRWVHSDNKPIVSVTELARAMSEIRGDSINPNDITSFATVSQLNGDGNNINIAPPSVLLSAEIELTRATPREDIENEIRDKANEMQESVRKLARDRGMQNEIPDAVVTFSPADGRKFKVNVRFHGVPGHAALPDKILNPNELCAPDMVGYLTRNFGGRAGVKMDQLNGRGHRGFRAEGAKLGATIRSFGGDAHADVKSRLESTARRIADDRNLKATVEFLKTGSYPALDNPDPLPEGFISTLMLASDGNVESNTNRITASEDYACYLNHLRARQEALRETDETAANRMEAAFYLLGAMPEGLSREAVQGHHTSGFVFNQRAMVVGLTSHVELGFNKLMQMVEGKA